MSALAGILLPRGWQPTGGELDDSLPWLRPQGPDREELVSRKPVVMWFGTFATRPGAIFEHQPCVDQGLLLTWDGRLDNRDELIRNAEQRNLDEPHLVLDLYRKHGCAGFRNLVGDFAFALWDPKNHRLILARDAFGARPLYFTRLEDRLVWASSLFGVLPHVPGSVEIDHEFVADYLTYQRLPHKAPYRGVEALGPGEMLVVEGDRFQSHKLWEPKIDPTREEASEVENEERFFALFSEAVESRMRLSQPAFAELSGGLDSSSIVCMADSLIDTGDVPHPCLQTVSYVYDESTSADERDFIAEVESRRSAGLHISDLEAPVLTPLPKETVIEAPTPSLLYAARYRLLARKMAEQGSRVLLRGRGGDQVTWGVGVVPFELADLLRTGQLVTMWRRAWEWARLDRRPVTGLLWEAAVQPLLAGPFGWAGNSSSGLRFPGFFVSDFERRFRLAKRLQSSTNGSKIDAALSPSQRTHFSAIRQAIATNNTGIFFPEGGVEVSHPYLHRPLVELCLSLPFRQKYRPGVARLLHRRALRGILPDAIARRQSKGITNEAMSRALGKGWADWQNVLEQPLVSTMGFVERDSFLQAMREIRHGLPGHGVIVQRVLSLELWLRSFQYHWTQRSRSPGSSSSRYRVDNGGSSTHDGGRLRRRTMENNHV